MAIVFAESGLLVGSFVLGDLLRFLASGADGNVVPELLTVIAVVVMSLSASDQMRRPVGPSGR
jgi:CBS domain-containing protein